MSCCRTARRVHLTCLPARATSASSCGAGPFWACSQLQKFCGGKGNRSLWPETSNLPEVLACNARTRINRAQDQCNTSKALAVGRGVSPRHCRRIGRASARTSGLSEPGRIHRMRPNFLKQDCQTPPRSSPARRQRRGLRHRHLRRHRRNCQSSLRGSPQEAQKWVREPDYPARRSSCRATGPFAPEFP
jgi:hypothetical protein